MIRKVAYLIVAAVLFLGLTAFPVQAATPEDIQTAIEAGLDWLVGQGQDTDPLSPYYGSWEGAGSREAGTGFALYKLCDRAHELGYESPFDPEYEYSVNVALGFTWLFNHLLIVPVSIQDHTSGATGTLDDPDTRVNGKGVMGTGGYESYHTGFMLTAIAASGTPGRTNEGGLDVDGDGVADTYLEIAQDIVDFLAFAQVDPSANWNGDMQEGGWDYVAVDNGAGGSGWQGDQSNCGYVVLGLAEAEAFGCTIPDWVKTELNWWIDWVQDDVTGGSWYSFTNDGMGMNILKTGNLLLEMRFGGDTPDTPRVLDALAYLSSNWNNPAGYPPDNGWKSGNPGVVASDYQTMFCIMKGLQYMGVPHDGISGVADWYMEFADAIIAEQDNATGRWPLPGNWEGCDENVLCAEWALLTLEKIAPPPPVITVSVDIHPRSWPNPLNVNKNGVLPVAVLGTEDFDVTQIDPPTILLAGVAPLRWALEDVGTVGDPLAGPDGFTDLTLKFDAQAIVAALDPVNDGDVVILHLTGNLKAEFGGTLIEGEDVVWIIKMK
jgi:hypothetical protein